MCFKLIRIVAVRTIIAEGKIMPQQKSAKLYAGAKRKFMMNGFYETL